MSRAVLSVLVVVSLLPILPWGEQGTVSATPSTLIRYFTGTGPQTTFTEHRSSSDFFYSRVNFTNAADLVVAGLQMTYKTTGNAPWNGYLQVNTTAGTNKQYEYTLPTTLGQTRTNTVNFNGPSYLLVHGNFTMSLYPNQDEGASLYLSAENLGDPKQVSHTYYWASATGWTDLTGYELMWTGRLEPTAPLLTGEPGATGTMDAMDTMDCYKVLLAGGTPYTIFLDNPDRKTYAVRLYQPDDLLRNPLAEITGKDPSPSFTYTALLDGFYYLVVEYPNNIGALDYGIKVRTNKMPVPVASGDLMVNINATAHFTADGSSDPDGDPLTYSWDFDASDGIQPESNKKSPTWTFRKGGNITVTLTVSDGKQSNSTTIKIKVNALPVGRITIDGIAELNETTRLNLAQNYTFKAEYTDPDRDKLSFHWDFGDNSSADTQVVRRAYADRGVFAYTLNLSVSETGGKAEATLALVFNRPPTASIVELKKAPALGKKVGLTGVGTDQDGYVAQYRWDFDGDGKVDFTSNETTADYTYVLPGTYNLTLYAVDNDGGIGKYTMPLVFKTKAAPKQNLLPVIAAVVVAVVVAVVLVLFLFMRKKKGPAPAQGPSVALAQTPPPVQPVTTEQTTYESLYGPKPVPVVEQPPPPPPPPPKPSGPTLVPPPTAARPAVARLVPPPKPV